MTGDSVFVELLLTLARPRVDCKPLAKDLLKRFGSLPALMAADPDSLRDIDGVGDSTVTALKIVQAAKEWGITGAVQVGLDMTQVQFRKDRIVTGLSKGVEFLFKKNKIDWIKGTARLTGNGGVDV